MVIFVLNRQITSNQVSAEDLRSSSSTKLRVYRRYRNPLGLQERIDDADLAEVHGLSPDTSHLPSSTLNSRQNQCHNVGYQPDFIILVDGTNIGHSRGTRTGRRVQCHVSQGTFPGAFSAATNGSVACTDRENNVRVQNGSGTTTKYSYLKTCTCKLCLPFFAALAFLLNILFGSLAVAIVGKFTSHTRNYVFYIKFF